MPAGLGVKCMGFSSDCYFTMSSEKKEKFLPDPLAPNEAEDEKLLKLSEELDFSESSKQDAELLELIGLKQDPQEKPKVIPQAPENLYDPQESSDTLEEVTGVSESSLKALGITQPGDHSEIAEKKEGQKEIQEEEIEIDMGGLEVLKTLENDPQLVMNEVAEANEAAKTNEVAEIEITQDNVSDLLLHKLQQQDDVQLESVSQEGVQVESVSQDDVQLESVSQDDVQLESVQQGGSNESDSVGSINSTPYRRILNEILFKQVHSEGETLEKLTELEKINGYDFPFLLSLLVENKFTGELLLEDAEGNAKHQVQISDGRILSVSTNGQEALLGNVLMEMGYLNVEDLNRILEDREIDQSESLGKKLVKANVMSPHALFKGTEHQIFSRLNRWVSLNQIKVTLSSYASSQESSRESSYKHTSQMNASITYSAFTNFLHSWVGSKLSLKWLESFYRPLSSCHLIKSSRLDRENDIFKKPLFLFNPKMLSTILETDDFKDIFELEPKLRESFLRGIHFLVIKQLISFSKLEGETSEEQSEEKMLDKLRTAHHDITQKDTKERIEYLGLSLDTFDEALFKVAVQDFMSIFSEPVHESKDSQGEYKQIYEQLFNILNETVLKLEDVNELKNLEEENTRANVMVLDSMGEVRRLLRENQSSRALEILEKMAEQNPNAKNLKEYMAWGKLNMINSSNLKRTVQEVEDTMKTFLYAEKLTARNCFLEGYLALHKKEYALAEIKLREAIKKSPSMVEASRLLNIIHLKIKEKNKSKNNSSLFKKRK